MSNLSTESRSTLLEEASRCLKCKAARCKKACPISTDIPLIMGLFLDGKEHEAGEALFENNPLSSICSIVCPHENNCYGNCVLGVKQTPISFFKIEQYLSGNYAREFDCVKPKKNGMRVAVVGAGPAGITMSIILAKKGFQITLMEAQEQIGGVLRYGIPEFRLPKDRVDVYKDILRKLGVTVKPTCYIGSNLSVDDMFMDGYDAVFLAVGTAKPNRLGLLGETLGHVHFAIDYLRAPKAHDLGKKVVVIGSGNVAMDVARTAIRADSTTQVTVINNKGPQEVTASREEVSMAVEEGVEFLHQLSPLRITEQGVLCANVEAIKQEDGTILYEEDMISHRLIEADSVILAIGQGPKSAPSGKAQIATTLRGLFVVDENGMTNIPGVFAAGDVVSGPKTVVEAVVYTKKVAEKLEQYCIEKQGKQAK